MPQLPERGCHQLHAECITKADTKEMSTNSFCCNINYKTCKLLYKATCVPCSLTIAQKVIRVDWFVDALKSRQVRVVRELLAKILWDCTQISKLTTVNIRGCPWPCTQAVWRIAED